jgi:hypothetical protein
MRVLLIVPTVIGLMALGARLLSGMTGDALSALLLELTIVIALTSLLAFPDERPDPRQGRR